MRTLLFAALALALAAAHIEASDKHSQARKLLCRKKNPSYKINANPFQKPWRPLFENMKRSPREVGPETCGQDREELAQW